MSHLSIKAIKGIIQSNTYIVEQDGVCLVIDAGAPAAKFKKALGDRKPAAIFLTHEHFDHVNHIGDYKFDGVPIYAHPSMGFTPLVDGQQINIEPFHITPIFALGHSEASVVYLVNGTLFSGDVLFRDCIGRTDLMKNGDAIMQNTLKIMQTLKFDTCYSGHGSPSTYLEQQKNIANYINN